MVKVLNFTAQFEASRELALGWPLGVQVRAGEASSQSTLTSSCCLRTRSPTSSAAIAASARLPRLHAIRPTPMKRVARPLTSTRARDGYKTMSATEGCSGRPLPRRPQTHEKRQAESDPDDNPRDVIESIQLVLSHLRSTSKVLESDPHGTTQAWARDGGESLFSPPGCPDNEPGGAGHHDGSFGDVHHWAVWRQHPRDHRVSSERGAIRRTTVFAAIATRHARASSRTDSGRPRRAIRALRPADGARISPVRHRPRGDVLGALAVLHAFAAA